MDCEQLRARYQVLKAERSTTESVWDTISRYIMPFKGEFFRTMTGETSVEWKNRSKFDDTAVEANITLASSIQGSVTSPVIRWFHLVFRDQKLNSDPEAAEWLRDCADTMFQALMESNFNLEISEAYLDLTGFGTAILAEEIEEKDQELESLVFAAVPLRDGFFEEDYKGDVLRFYRRYEWTSVKIMSKFGDKIPDYIKDQAESSTGMLTKHEIIYAIYPRKGKENSDVSKPIATEARPFGAKYILLKDATQLGDKGGYYEMPVFITRWGKATGSKWGYSPSHICLGDVLTLNAMVKMILIAGEKVIDPATLQEERALVGDLDLEAGGVTVVRNAKGLVPYESKARFDVSNLHKKDLQDSIRRCFKVDQLEMKESPAMTATEVQVRYELMQRLLGPTLGRLQNDLLDPLIGRTFYILYRSGRLPPPPESVVKNSSELDVEYLGPLARAQKMDKIVSMQRWFQLASPIAEFDPGILDLPDVDQIGKEAATLLGVPIKGDKEIKKIREDRAAQQAAAQQMAQHQAEGEAMGAVGTGLQEIRNAEQNPGDAQNAAQNAAQGKK